MFNQSPQSEAVLREVGRYGSKMKASGHLVAAHALQLPQTAMTVQVRDGKTWATDGPFMETKEVLGGLVLIEAADMTEAVGIAARIPFAQLGAIEVRPLVDSSSTRATRRAPGRR